MWRAGRGGWQLGLRAREAGVELCYEHEAVAVRDAGPSALPAIERARAHGRGDALLRERHPALTAAILAPTEPPSFRRRPLAALYERAIGYAGPERVSPVLGLLEALRFRGTWARLFSLARREAYAPRRLGGAESRPVRAVAESLRVELNSDAPIPPPPVSPPLLELTLDGTPIGQLRPLGGRWDGSLADQVADVAGRWVTSVRGSRPRPLEETPTGRDLSGIAVMLGPARHAGDGRYRGALEAAGATVTLIDGDPARHWTALDRAIRACGQESVALPLPGVAAGPEWLAAARPALTGDRVAVAVGGALALGAPPSSSH